MDRTTRFWWGAPRLRLSSRRKRIRWSTCVRRFQWNMEDNHLLRLSLIGKNLNDKEYLTEALPLGNGGLRRVGYRRGPGRWSCCTKCSD